MTPEVSVIVPNYNHARFLQQRIGSILAQTYRDFELILLDDHSTDNSREILEAYSDRPEVSHIVVNAQNSGSTFSQWKKGLELAKGKYVWIAESDDYCDPDFLATAVERLENGADLFYCRTVRVWEDGTPTDHQFRWYEDISPDRWKSDFENDAVKEAKEVLAVKCVINNASAVVFRNTPAVMEVLQGSLGMRYAGDWLFWTHYLLRSRKLAYSVATKNYFRTHAATTRADSRFKRNKEMLRVLAFILENSDAGHRRFLVDYFFRNHFQKGNARQLRTNIPLFFRSMRVSLHFFRCWWNYYFSPAKPGLPYPSTWSGRNIS